MGSKWKAESDMIALEICWNTHKTATNRNTIACYISHYLHLKDLWGNQGGSLCQRIWMNLMKYLRVKPKEKMKLATLMWCKRQIFEPCNKWRWYCWWMVYRHIQQFEVYYTIYWESRETIFRGCWWIVC